MDDRARTLIFVAIAAVSAVAAPQSHAAFPGVNGRIAFSSSQDGNREIYTMNAVGSDQKRLTFDAAADDYPAWSPDGETIAFASQRDGNSEIYLLNPNGTTPVPLRLTNNSAPDSQPVWSPYGTEIAFTSDRDGNREIYKMDADGTDQTRVTVDATNTDESPSWSPDGTKIAFFKDPPGSDNGDIYSISPDGSSPLRLTTYADADAGPDWSPTGDRIVFYRDVTGTSGPVWRLYKMNANGSGITQVTGNNTVDNMDPAWSPDGSRLVYQRVTGSNTDVYTIAETGTGGETRLTTPGTFDGHPDWQPAPVVFERPGVATPLRVPLVVAYEPCTAPDSTHVGPKLSPGPGSGDPSCTSPSVSSDQLATSGVGKLSAFTRFTTILGNLNTVADEADIALEFHATDVRRRSDSSDYEGPTILRMGMRLTDEASGPGGGTSATVQDTDFSLPVNCLATPSPNIASSCDLTTTSDSLVPDFAKEGRRAIITTLSLSLLDAGANGTIGGPDCAPDCGDGDEEVFLEQGLFVP